MATRAHQHGGSKALYPRAFRAPRPSSQTTAPPLHARLRYSDRPVGTQAAAPHSHYACRSASPSDNGSLPSYTTCDNCQTRSISVHQPNKYTWHRLLACPPEPSSECDICGGCLDSSLNDMSQLTRTAQPHYCFRCGDSFARGDRLLAHSQVSARGYNSFNTPQLIFEILGAHGREAVPVPHVLPSVHPQGAPAQPPARLPPPDSVRDARRCQGAFRAFYPNSKSLINI